MTYRFIDTHCHFDFPPFTGDEKASLARAANAGVEKIIVPAIGAGRFNTVLALARDYPAVYAALGLHPMYIEQHDDAALQALDNALASQPEKVVAVGETGLDAYRESPDLPKQVAMLQAQFALAKRWQLPVILHSRRTHDKLAMLLRQASLPKTGVVHGFSGSFEQAMRFIELGYYIGVGGTITYPRAAKTRKAISRLPLEALVLETDAPDMPLNGWKGQANRPERVALVFDILCQLRSENPEEIADAVWRNTCALFPLVAQTA